MKDVYLRVAEEYRGKGVARLLKAGQLREEQG
jgi:hypothetical protein